MAMASPFLQPQAKPTITRGDQFGSESLEKKAETNSQSSQQAKVDSYNTWNSFLAPSSDIKFERLDTTPVSVTQDPTSAVETPVVVEEKVPTFEEIFLKLKSEEQGENVLKQVQEDNINEQKDTLLRQEFNIVEEKRVSKLEGSIFFSKSENIVIEAQNSGGARNDETNENGGVKKEIRFMNKEKLMGSAESIANVTTKVSKRGFKEGKDVYGAVKDLWTSFIGFREKKPDPKAKENAEKAAKRKANKLRFVSLLKEGMSIYYAEMRKALIELEVKLGVNVLRVEDKNRLLGRNRNMSFEKLDSVYEIHQVAFAMAEHRKQQQQASKPVPMARGKASRGQIFTDKNLSGERSAGNNMMSAVG